MKPSISFSLVFFAFFWGSAQETPGNNAKIYIFKTEYQYRQADDGKPVITFQFTEDRFMRIVYGKGQEFMLIDMEDGFRASNLGGSLNIEKIPAEYSSAVRRIELSRKGETRYKGYDCNVYHIMMGQDLLKFYIEKKASLNFNPMLVSLFAVDGIIIDENTIPKGRIIAGMEVKDGNDIDTIELASVKEDQNITFTLNTN